MAPNLQVTSTATTTLIYALYSTVAVLSRPSSTLHTRTVPLPGPRPEPESCPSGAINKRHGLQYSLVPEQAACATNFGPISAFEPTQPCKPLVPLPAPGTSSGLHSPNQITPHQARAYRTRTSTGTSTSSSALGRINQSTPVLNP